MEANAKADAAFVEPQERRRPPVRHEGDSVAEAPARVMRPKRLAIVGIDERVDLREIDLWHDGFLTIERPVPRLDAPWVVEPEIARFGLVGVASVELVDVDPDDAT